MKGSSNCKQIILENNKNIYSKKLKNIYSTTKINEVKKYLGNWQEPSLFQWGDELP